MQSAFHTNDDSDFNPLNESRFLKRKLLYQNSYDNIRQTVTGIWINYNTYFIIITRYSEKITIQYRYVESKQKQI